VFASSFLSKATGGEMGVRLAALATPGRDKSGPYPVAIASLGLRRQFATSISKDGEHIVAPGMYCWFLLAELLKNGGALWPVW
jgi:hypothetical protein